MINRQGIAKTLDLPRADEEEAGLKRSAQIIQDGIASFNLDERISIGQIPSSRFVLKQKETV